MWKKGVGSVGVSMFLDGVVTHSELEPPGAS